MSQFAWREGLERGLVKLPTGNKSGEDRCLSGRKEAEIKDLRIEVFVIMLTNGLDCHTKR